MKIITTKSAVRPVLENALRFYKQSGDDAFIDVVHKTILERKIKYPVLEYIAEEFYKHIPGKKQVGLVSRIIDLKENGSDVLAGKILQLRLPDHYDESIKKAIEYIITGSNWLSCDTIGERVFGYALLTQPEKTLPVLKKLAKHENNWIIRSIGVADHYAVKKGLKKEFVEEMFGLLISLAITTDFHTRKGIGWGAKTTAKFHPDIIRKYEKRLDENSEIRQWFKSKIKIGLGRSYKYAHRYTG